MAVDHANREPAAGPQDIIERSIHSKMKYLPISSPERDASVGETCFHPRPRLAADDPPASHRIATRATVPRPRPAEQPVALQLAVQRRRPDVELLGGAGLISFVQLEHCDDVLLLDLVERAYDPAGAHPGERAADLLGQVLELDPTSARERDRALHQIGRAHV